MQKLLALTKRYTKLYAKQLQSIGWISKIPQISFSPKKEFQNFQQQKQVYISKYFTSQDFTRDIENILKKFSLKYKEIDRSYSVQFCPFCPKSHNNEKSNMYTLGIQKIVGTFNCFRCGVKGNWFMFKDLLFGNTDVNSVLSNNQISEQIQQTLSSAEYYHYHKNLLDKQGYEEQIIYLTGNDQQQRHINFEILEKYKIGLDFQEFQNEIGEYISIPVICELYLNKKITLKFFKKNIFHILFPMFIKKAENQSYKNQDQNTEDNDQNEDNQQNENSLQTIEIDTDQFRIVKAKVRGLYKTNKHHMRVMPSGNVWGLFGLNTISEEDKEIVITEGEFDAMAVNQACGLPAISLPNGCQHLPSQVLRYLEQFTTIYLWLDEDEAGRQNRQILAKKLGLSRTKIVQTSDRNGKGPKDANDILREDPSKILQYRQARQKKTSRNRKSKQSSLKFK